MPPHSPSGRATRYRVDPMSGAGTSGQGCPDESQFPYNMPEFAEGYSMSHRSQDPSYSTSRVIYGSEGSRSGFVTSHYSSFLRYSNDSCNRSSSAGTPSSARSTPITSPGISTPYFGGEIVMDAQHQGNGSWITRAGVDCHYDHPEPHTSP